MSIVKSDQKSVRVVLPKAVYDRIKMECKDHGDLSRLVRALIIKHLEGLRDEEELKHGTGS